MNVEVDVLAKYVERLVAAYRDAPASGGGSGGDPGGEGHPVTEDRLREAGF